MLEDLAAWAQRIENRLDQMVDLGGVLAHNQRRIIRRLDNLTRLENIMSKEMDDLVAEVANSNAGVESALVAIDGLRQQIIDAGTDPAKLQALTASLASERTKLAEKIVTPPPGGAPAPQPSLAR